MKSIIYYTNTMSYHVQSPFTCNLKAIIIDEIALDGLEGIAPNLLWKRIEARICAPVTEKMKKRYWDFIVNCDCITIYELKKPLPDVKLIDRLTIVDPETGYLIDPDDYLDGPYEYLPADNDNGSSENYGKRRKLHSNIGTLPYEKVSSEYGNMLALVASVEERWKALAPDMPLSFMAQLGPLNYCMLELIGRARQNGQMTTGKTNLTKIVKDSKILFYHRKALQDLDLVRVTCVTQVTAGRAVKGLLIRLKRFHKSDILTVPKIGLIHDLVEYLKKQPNFCDKTEMVIKKGLMTQAQNKKYQKKVSIFHFEEKPVAGSEVLRASTSQDTTEHFKKPIRKRYMGLISKSDESSQSEDEETPPLKCQYKVGVNILRQAYERFLEAGRNGLTQYELAQLVGIEFYICRTICRIFKNKNIIREFIECKGRQRMGRYIAIAATSKMDSKLAEEKEKFQKLLDEGKSLCKKIKRSKSELSSDSETLISVKKRKLENEDTQDESGITEVTQIDGVRKPVERKLNLKSKVSLRQLKFANGILKALHERMFVLGYQTLSNLVAQECNEPPMDTKAMKLLLQGMVSAGNLKIYKMMLPRSQYQYSVMICAPHIKPNDPLLRARYKEICQRVRTNQNIAMKKVMNHTRPLAQYAYPRYVKVQKLHESLIQTMYFSDYKSEESDLPKGFFSIKGLIPQLTVGVALGHISSEGVIDVSKFTIEDSLLEVRVCDAPADLCRALMKSNNLQSSLRTILRILAQFGLIQFIVQPTSDATEVPDNCMAINLFYVNKVAKIVDTAGLWPRKNAPIETLEREFRFDSMEVVKEYWQAVYHISTNTTVEVPNRRQKNIQNKAPVRTMAQAVEMDKGERFGDDMGPCGFDSMYYLDVPRLWKAYCIRSTSMKSKQKKGPVKIPKFDIPKKPKQKKKAPKKVAVKVKKTEVDVTKQAVKLGKKNKKRMRCSKMWSLEDDRVLMMCKTAITIMSPISQPGCLRVRNLVAKDILSTRDPKKTQGLCHKRAAYIETNSSLIHERNCVLNELRRQQLIGKYEGLLKKLRILHSTNMTKYINEARIPMMELVWIIYQTSKTMPLLQEIPVAALNLEEFHKNYTIVSSSANQPCSLYKTPHDSEVKIATLKEAILLTVMQSFSNNVNKEMAQIIYSYFHKHPECDLRAAIEPLRKCGAIAAKDKVIRTQLHIVELDDIVQCSYRLSAVYQRKWISRLNTEFSDNLCEVLKEDVNKDAVKGSAETNCFSFEQQANGLLDIVAATVPAITGPSGSIIQEDQLNVIDIATNFKLKSGTIGWKNKSNFSTFSDLYKGLKINEALDRLARQSIFSNEILKNKNVDTEHEILTYLMTKREKGATLKELQEALNYDRDTLTKLLTELQDKTIIKRVGFYENAVILMKYLKHWSMSVPGGRIIPVPWLTVYGKIRHEIFFKWAGVIMNKIYEYPGSSLTYISDSFEFLSVKAVQDVCEMLRICECITLHTLFIKEPSLFSDDDDTIPELSDYNEFEDPQKTVAMPVRDGLSKYSFIKGEMLIKSETSNFISEDSL